MDPDPGTADGSVRDAILSDYDVDAESCERDVRAPVADLIERGPADGGVWSKTVGGSEVLLEALSSPRLSQVMARLALLADLVIWDSAPVVALTDAALIANYADAVLNGVTRETGTGYDYYCRYTGRYGYVLREPWVSYGEPERDPLIAARADDRLP